MGCKNIFKLFVLAMFVWLSLVNYSYAEQTKGSRVITLVNQCPFPVWFGFISGATKNRAGQETCGSDADCFENNVCVDRGAGGKHCFWKNPVPQNGQYQLAPSNGTNSVQIPVFLNALGSIWSGGVAGRTNCTAAGCQTADCGGGVGGCPAGRGFAQPATQAEFTFNKNAPDYYDVEVINGINIPVAMQPTLSQTKPCNGKGPCDQPYNCGSPGSPSPVTQTGSCSWNLVPPSNDYKWIVPGGNACASDGDCQSGTVCGLSDNPGQNPRFKKTCGKLLGYWTADQICGIDNKYGAPFNCAQPLPAPQQNLTLSNLYGCSPIGSCYSNGAPNTCCGCVNWDKIGIPVPPGPLTQQCNNSNPTWTANVQPKLTWLKQACPTAYTYPFDDMSSTFTCQIMADDNGTSVNSVNYTITYCPGGNTGGVTG